MPELPEVETIRRQLGEVLPGRRVISTETMWHKSLTGRGLAPDVIVGRQVTGVWRRGKVLGIDLERGISILVHLRMTGQLLLGAGGGCPSTTSMTRAVLELDNGSRLLFNDQRKFGRMVVLPSTDVAGDPLLARMGPEPLDAEFDPDGLAAILRRHPGLRLKSLLLDQSAVAGIGNIYADEALWHAGLHPERRCGTVRRPAVEALHAGIVAVLSTGLDLGGSTLRDYVDARGERGNYLDVAAVYGRSGQPCRRCATTIVKRTVAGRGTHVCPVCQKAPRRSRTQPY